MNYLDLMKPAYLPNLTPLRGIAAILVITLHTEVFVYPVVPFDQPGFIWNNWIWVDFFFVLSGFIMFHVYQNAFSQKVGSKEYWKYVGARFARVYPLHFFTLIWMIIVGFCLLGMSDVYGGWMPFYKMIFDPRAIPTSVFMLQAMHFHATAPFNTPSWSLSTEWWMYMLFPFFVIPFIRFGRWSRLLVLIAIAGFYALLKYFIVARFGMHFHRPTGATLNTINDFAFLRCMAGFFLGMLAYSCYQAEWAKKILANSWVFLALWAAAIVMLVYGQNELLVVATFPLIILGAAYNTTGVSRVLAKKPWQRLGDWSFSIYMVHVPIAFTYHALVGYFPRLAPKGYLDQSLPYSAGWWYFAAFLAVTIVVASQTYRYVEVPYRKYLNARFGHASAKASAIPGAAVN